MKQLLDRPVAFTGEAIDPRSAAEMVKDYQQANPDKPGSYLLGKDILRAVMGQKGCRGLRFYNAVNEGNAQTLVYVALNSKSNLLKPHAVIDDKGMVKEVPPIVADRARPGPKRPEDGMEWGIPE